VTRRRFAIVANPGDRSSQKQPEHKVLWTYDETADLDANVKPPTVFKLTSSVEGIRNVRSPIGVGTIPHLRGFAAADGLDAKGDEEIRAAIGDKFPKAHQSLDNLHIRRLIPKLTNTDSSSSTSCRTSTSQNTSQIKHLDGRGKPASPSRAGRAQRQLVLIARVAAL
jgi:hypothetical protein